MRIPNKQPEMSAQVNIFIGKTCKNRVTINARLWASGAELEHKGAWSKFLAMFPKRTDARDSAMNLYKTHEESTYAKVFRTINVVQACLRCFLYPWYSPNREKHGEPSRRPIFNYVHLGAPFDPALWDFAFGILWHVRILMCPLSPTREVQSVQQSALAQTHFKDMRTPHLPARANTYYVMTQIDR